MPSRTRSKETETIGFSGPLTVPGTRCRTNCWRPQLLQPLGCWRSSGFCSINLTKISCLTDGRSRRLKLSHHLSAPSRRPDGCNAHCMRGEMAALPDRTEPDMRIMWAEAAARLLQTLDIMRNSVGTAGYPIDETAAARPGLDIQRQNQWACGWRDYARTRARCYRPLTATGW
jgi:hypothetical protein